MSETPNVGRENGTGIPTQFFLQLAPHGYVVKSNPAERKVMIEFRLINGAVQVEADADEEFEKMIAALQAAYKKAKLGIIPARSSDLKGIAGS